MTNELVVVFGGGGFLGRYVVQALLKTGARVRVAQRRTKNAHYLKAMANLGQIQFASADITSPESVARAVQGADRVINLVGSFANMHAIQHLGAKIVAEAAKKAGAKALVHVSAIGADVESPSAYGRSKGEGEEAVREAFAGATILQPSIIFGREDQFTNRFAGLIRMAPVMPLIGGDAKFQPAYVADVAHAVAQAVAEPGRFGGKSFELGGPQVMTMAELNQWIADATGRTPFFVEVPDFISGPLATLTGWLPGAPITRDQWLMLQKDNVVADGAEGFAAFGIAPTALASAAPGWLVLYKKHGRFGGKAAA